MDACLERPRPLVMALTALVAWQFLVGAYPGQIVSAAYCSLAFLFVRATSLGYRQALTGLAALLAAGLIALGLSMVKFLPILVDDSSIRQSADQASQLDLPMLSTLLFDFDVSYLGNDVTMRNLFLPLPILLLAPLGVGRGKAWLAAGVMAGVAVFFMVDPWGLAAKLPLFSVSRFHLADYRPMLHLGLVLCAAIGLDRLGKQDHPAWKTLLLASLAIGVVLALVVLGSRLGVPPDRRWLVSGLLLASVALSVAWRYWGGQRDNARAALATGLLLATTWQGVDHVTKNNRVWKVERSDAAEVAIYGAPLKQLLDVDRYDALDHRPRRLVVGDLPADRSALYDPRYGRSWVSERFSAFGYDDLKGSPTFQKFYEGAGQPAGSEVRKQLDWLVARSQVIVGPTTLSAVLAAAERCGDGDGACDATGQPDRRVTPRQFLENGEVWEIASSAALAVTQNETWYQGWKSRICDARERECRPGPDAQGLEGLRSWELPAGQYRLVTFYEPPHWALAKWLSWLSAAALLLLAAMHLAIHHRLLSSPRKKPV